MSNHPPALPDVYFRETLDLLSRVVASMSDRLDAQAEALEVLTKTTVEARQASLVTKAHTDPKLFARHIGQEIGNALDPIIDRFAAVHRAFGDDREMTRGRLEELIAAEEELLHRIRNDHERAQRWKRRVPFMATSALVLLLGLGVALPRAVACDNTFSGSLSGKDSSLR